jgi:hypothetical protein
MVDAAPGYGHGAQRVMNKRHAKAGVRQAATA